MSGARRGITAAIALAVAVVLGACSIFVPSTGDEEGTTVDVLAPVIEAVLAADPAVLAVDEISPRINGLGQALFVHLIAEGSDAMAVGELRRILRAIWTTAPFRPNSLRMVISRPGGVGAIDLAPAAEEMMPGHWRPFGDRGVSLGVGGLIAVLGPWEPTA